MSKVRVLSTILNGPCSVKASTTPLQGVRGVRIPHVSTYSLLVQRFRMSGLHPEGRRFESYRDYNKYWVVAWLVYALDC